ncbi:MAG: hypothetical protein CM1200mP20_12250 [Pseudomonadota bacterium]|nr:MAG: hypothetical protein CM1200mP20_12250 [Pseudomonadota bacterium]
MQAGSWHPPLYNRFLGGGVGCGLCSDEKVLESPRQLPHALVFMT